MANFDFVFDKEKMQIHIATITNGLVTFTFADESMPKTYTDENGVEQPTGVEELLDAHNKILASFEIEGDVGEINLDLFVDMIGSNPNTGFQNYYNEVIVAGK